MKLYDFSLFSIVLEHRPYGLWQWVSCFGTIKGTLVLKVKRIQIIDLLSDLFISQQSYKGLPLHVHV